MIDFLYPYVWVVWFCPIFLFAGKLSTTPISVETGLNKNSIFFNFLNFFKRNCHLPSNVGAWFGKAVSKATIYSNLRFRSNQHKVK